jgi:iron(III) transport system permease protein
MRRATRGWLIATTAAFVLLPWYAIEDGFFGFGWLREWGGTEAAPGLLQAIFHGRWWLWPLLGLVLAPWLAIGRRDRFASGLLIACGALGVALLLVQGFAIGARGLAFRWARELLPEFEGRQYGMGWGALVVGLTYLALLADGLSRRGALRGDPFALGAILLIVASTLLFVFYPVALVLGGAAKIEDGYALAAMASRLSAPDIWSLGCLTAGYCGVFWKTLLLAVIVAVLTTALGLAFALLGARTDFRYKGALRLFALLPIITPPFVVALAIIALFGRTGAITTLLYTLFDIPPSRYIYGLPGMILAQVLSFTPVAYLILIGVVQGVSPSMEEAAQTLRGSRTRVFFTVTLPLIRPGLANAFLVGILESISDFGNAIVLAGNYDVLSIQIYFALIGAQSDEGRAAALALILLVLALVVFIAQSVWLGTRTYTTVSGKGDAGVHAHLPRRVALTARWTAVPWAILTALIYGLILIGGCVENFGRDFTPTLKHFATILSVGWGEHGLVWTGGAWNSLFTTLASALVAAPLTAAMGLLTAYVLARQRFTGKGAFEFITMLSFAIPGTVVGIAYIMAFNTPPIELTGTLIILILCFVFRDMPVGIRAGIAAMSQLDRSLDESSMTLRHGGFATVRRVILPLIRPAIVAALVFGLVRAICSLSAVIFLVTTRHNLATAYIIGQIEIANYGAAIAYSAVLVAIMATMIWLIQLAVGERQLGRRALVPA